jgi:hypothetical protein
MIVAAATVPAAPLLLPGLTGGPVEEVLQARKAMTAAVAALLDRGASELVVVGAAPETRPYPSGAPGPEARFSPYLPGGGPGALPVALAVGRSVLGECPVPWTLHGVRSDEDRDGCRALGHELGRGERLVGLLAVADGSARRTEKAPGYVDPDAIALDARIGAALAAADTAALLELDAAACERALVGGRPAWQVMAAACEDRTWESRVLYEDDPFGVAYWVVTWT